MDIKQWESKTGLKQAKGFISGPSARITRDLFGIKQRPIKMGARTVHRTLTPKWTSFQTEIDRRISHTYVM
jgi:hypothetical protein